MSLCYDDSNEEIAKYKDISRESWILFCINKLYQTQSCRKFVRRVVLSDFSIKTIYGRNKEIFQECLWKT